jgi:phosphoserine aminotransferase
LFFTKSSKQTLASEGAKRYPIAMNIPSQTPANPNFSSGPCAKRPGWSLAALEKAVLGRSHRSGIGKARLKEAIELAREVLGIPTDYKIGIVPASDTGAYEMAMWSVLGARGVDVLAWESFGKGWLTDATKQLKLQDIRTFEADYGEIVDLSAVGWNRDVCFTWNGTTSGVKCPNGDWIAADREGLSICDATSAVYAMEMPWDKLDITTWSWQKVLGGEAAHGMIVLSPRAVERLESYTPDWPLPKIFRLTKGGKLINGIFEGATINTPSMLCVEDVIDAHEWAKSIGGLPAMLKRSQANLAAISKWVGQSDWAAFLAEDEAVRSNTSICLKITDSWFTAKTAEEQLKTIKAMTKLLDERGVAYDIAGYRDAPAGLRVWGGATVETSDIEALLPWLDWAYAQMKQQAAEAA